jgi:hypothetical protein
MSLIHLPHAPGARSLTLLASALSLLLLVISVTILSAGWLIGVETLMRPLPDHPAIAPRTVFAFVLASTAMLVRLRTHLQKLVAILGFLLAGVVGVEEIHFLWADVPWRSNHMAVATEVGFYAAAYGLITYDARIRAYRHATLGVVIGGLVWAALPVLWFGMGSTLLDRAPFWRGMAPHTILAFVMLFSAMLLGHVARDTFGRTRIFD